MRSWARCQEVLTVLAKRTCHDGLSMFHVERAGVDAAPEASATAMRISGFN